MRAVLTLVAGLALSAFATQQLAAAPPKATEVHQVHFTCADGSALDVTFKGYRADVAYGGKTVQLAQKPAASGFWYRDRHHSLRGKNDEVQWGLGAAAPTTCKAGG